MQYFTVDNLLLLRSEYRDQIKKLPKIMRCCRFCSLQALLETKSVYGYWTLPIVILMKNVPCLSIVFQGFIWKMQI